MAESVQPGGGAPGGGTVVRFGVYELDSRAGELRRQGLKVRLQEKPLRVLELLLSRRGEAVSRDELRAHLWPDDVFVDFDHSLNSAVSKLRDALRDPASSPQFIETLPRGYRFIAAVVESARPERSEPGQPETELPSDSNLVTPLATVEVAGPHRLTASRPRTWVKPVLAVLGLLSFVASAWFGIRLGSQRTDSPETLALAVLPFENLSGRPDEEFFSDGITDEMIAQLGRVDPEHLRVIGRTSAMHYKHTNKRIDEIGAELQVGYVLEGTVRRSGSRVRITAQLVRARDQVRVWAQSYDRDAGDVLALQTEVAQATARQIAVAFDGRVANPAPRVDPDVYEAYLKGRFFLDKVPSRLDQSIQHFEDVIKLDPRHAGAFAGLAEAYEALGWGFGPGSLRPQEAYPRMLESARKALSLDPNLAVAHTAIGRIRYEYEWNWRGAEESLRRAVELDPNSANAHSAYFDFLSVVGRADEAARQVQMAATLDPLSLKVTWEMGTHFMRTGDRSRAFEWLNKARDLDPSSGFVHYLLGQAHIDSREYATAITELQEAVRLSPDTPQFIATLAHARAMSGDRVAAQTALRSLHELAGRGYVSPVAFAVVHAGLGQKVDALDALDTAYLNHDPWLSLLGVMRRFDSLRAEPRYAALLQKVGLPRTSMETK